MIYIENKIEETLSVRRRTSPGVVWARTAAAIVVALTGQASLAQISDTAKLEEVLVTATRRAETDIQTTPVAVTAISGSDVDRLVPTDLGDVLGLAPNVINGKQPGFNSANFAIRGVGQNGIILYFENQVGVIVDDMVIPHIQTANVDMLDVSGVEILRGPQGTLFGKNTTGGVVNVKTNRPELGGNSLSLRGQAAEYGKTEARAVLNIALGGEFGFRAAILKSDSDGYYENGAAYGPVADFGVGFPLVGATGQGNGGDIGATDVFSGRFKLRWQPSDELDMNLAYEVVRDRGDQPPSVNETPDGGYLWNTLGFTRDPGSERVKVAGATNRNDRLLEMGTKGHEIDVDGIYLNVDWELNDSYTVNLFGGRRETDSWLANTYTGEVGPVSLFDATRQDERETTQIEVRIASDLDANFNFVAGAFYQNDETLFAVSQVLGFVDMTIPSGLLFGDPQFFNNNPQVLSNGQDAEAMAIYFDGTWEINDVWTLGAGVRYTDEEKEWTGRNQVFIQALGGGFDPNLNWQTLGEPLNASDFKLYPTGVVRDDESWSEPTWRVTLGYEPSSDLYLYGTYSRGFKSGGYNDQTGTGGNPIEPLQARPTDPETADSVEFGMRSEWLDGQLRFNLTGFYVTYDDSQQQLLAEIEADRDGDGINESTFQETRFFNAAEIEVYGLEIESVWRVTDSFRMQGSLGWMESEFKEFQADTNFDGTIDTTLDGNPVARAPELTYNLDFLFDQTFASGNLEWNLNLNYVDEATYAYTSVPSTPDGITDERVLVNAAVTYRPSDGAWWVRGFGKNLADEEYRLGELPVANLWVMSYYGQPITFGVEAGINFDW